jgi:hypothetical protein
MDLFMWNIKKNAKIAVQSTQNSENISSKIIFVM